MKSVISIVFNDFRNDSRVLKECVSLQKNGYAVQVLANYKEGLPEKETIQGIPVHRIKVRSRKISRNGLSLIKYLEFAVTVIRFYSSADYIHVNDLNPLPIAVLVKIIFNRRTKIIYDAHEYETETKDMKGLKKFLARMAEKHLIRFADKVITVADKIAEEYTRLYHIPKPALVLNCPPYTPITDEDKFRETFGLRKDQTIFLYQGGLSKDRGIETTLEAFSKMNDDKVVIFMGYGPLQSLIGESASRNRNIFYHPAVSPDVLLEYTASADFGIFICPNSCLNYYYCSPNKIFEYTMAGLPIIVSDLFEMGRLVRKHGIGIVADSDTVAGIITATETISQMGKNSFEKKINVFREIYNWEAQEKSLINAYTR